MMLFKNTDNTSAYIEDTGWREFYVWTGHDTGWMHSTQVSNPVAISREYEPNKLPANYGTERFLEDKRNQIAEDLKSDLAHVR